MAVNDRPGGMTALSVLNGFFALGVGGTTIQRFVASYELMAKMDGSGRFGRRRGQYFQSLLDEGLTPLDLQILGVMGLIATIFLLVSIWGILKQSNLLGRWLGTIGGGRSRLFLCVFHTMASRFFSSGKRTFHSEADVLSCVSDLHASCNFSQRLPE